LKANSVTEVHRFMDKKFITNLVKMSFFYQKSVKLSIIRADLIRKK